MRHGSRGVAAHFSFLHPTTIFTYTAYNICPSTTNITSATIGMLRQRNRDASATQSGCFDNAIRVLRQRNRDASTTQSGCFDNIPETLPLSMPLHPSCFVTVDHCLETPEGYVKTIATEAAGISLQLHLFKYFEQNKALPATFHHLKTTFRHQKQDKKIHKKILFVILQSPKST